MLGGWVPWEHTPGSVPQGAEVRLCPTVPYQYTGNGQAIHRNLEFQTETERALATTHEHGNLGCILTAILISTTGLIVSSLRACDSKKMGSSISKGSLAPDSNSWGLILF